MQYLQRLGFLSQLWRVNLLSAMEYRVSFITQILGMILQNGLYFVFWILFFDRFEALHGWTLQDMILLFAIVGTGLGLDHDAIRELHSNSHDRRRRRSGSLLVPTSPDIAACAGVANFRALCW